MKKIRQAYIILLCIILSAGLSACSGGGGSSKPRDPDAKPRTTVESPSMTEAPGEVVFSNGVSYIDASRLGDGYIMVNYTGSAQKVQIQITNPNGELYPYPLSLGDWRAFPLTGGSGRYNIDIFEAVSGDLYSANFSQSVDATITDEFRPYLYPNQYVDYRPESQVVSLGKDLSSQSYDDLSYVQNVYNYATSNISYDTEFASHAPADYIPNPDNTLSTRKGICFDYASVMSSMLRSQAIPTKLVVGYSGEAYHAWISVYLQEQGWVDNIIQFDGTNWSLMDPTLAAGNNASAVAQYIGDGSNYTAKYTY